MEKPKPYKRRDPTKAEVLEILATSNGVDVDALALPAGACKERPLLELVLAQIGHFPCAKFSVCGNVIRRRKDCQRDHTISLRSVPEHMRKEYDRADNQRYLCLDCHAVKTHKRGATGMSDAAIHAKIRRGEKRRDAPQPGKGSSWVKTTRLGPWPKPSKPWPDRGGTIPSRGFPKQQRPLRGK
jgi:hypothetical protein